MVDVGEEGETWMVITSARKGLTDIVAYSPDIVAADEEGNKNPNPHKVFATKVWDCYDWVFPPPAINDCEEFEHTFTTKIFNYLTQAAIGGIDVRYTILNPQDSIFADDGTQTVIPSDSNGLATVTLQAPIEPIPTEPIEVMIEILLRDDMDICDGREFVIGCTTVTKRWEVDTLMLSAIDPQILCVEDAGSVSVEFYVENISANAAEDVTLTVSIPAGITLADPNASTMTWARIEANEIKTHYNFRRG
jgi:hypothetical protein